MENLSNPIQDLTVERHENTWVFSDGTILPVISGGDETATGNAGGGAQTGTDSGSAAGTNGNAQDPQGGEGQGQSQGQGTDDGYNLGAGFLQRVPEEHRSILEPYVKQWDAGVTRRFQELHSQVAPYQELGDLEELQQAVGLAQMLQDNPWQVYGILQQAIQAGEFGPQPQDFGQQGQPAPQNQPLTETQPGQEQGLNGNLDPAVAQRIDQLQNAVVALGQHILQQQQTQTTEQEDAQLDQWLTGLHDEFGDFDDRWVLSRVLQDIPVEQAIQEFTDLINERASKQTSKNQSVLPLLGAGAGGSGVPNNGEAGVKSLSRKQTQDLVASVLAKNAQQ